MEKNIFLLPLVFLFLFLPVGFPFPFHIEKAYCGDETFLDLLGGTTIYYPHISSNSHWETEVAVINTDSSPATGTLIAYDKDGSQIGSALNVSLPANGRRQYIIGSSFDLAASIAYMKFTSETFGLKGYTKFYQSDQRASIMASVPQSSGIFTKIEQDGWTGIALINTESSTAQVSLTAYNDDGDIVATAQLSLAAGAKVVDFIENLFDDDVSAATYATYSSDRELVGFFLNGSSNYNLLDGSRTL